MAPRFNSPENLSRYRGFIFDCDGTLIDSMPLHFSAWKEALSAAGARFEFTWTEFLSRAGMSLDQTVAELEVKFGERLDRQTVAQVKRRAYALRQHEIPPIVEVVEFARALHGHFPLAVATGSRRAEVETTLERLGLLSLFETIVTPSDVARGKPEPDMFLLAAERIQVAPEACLVLEDGESGLEAARRARMDYVVVQPSPNPR